MQDMERASIRARRMRASILTSHNDLSKAKEVSVNIDGNVYYNSKTDDGSKIWNRMPYSFHLTINIEQFVKNNFQFEQELDFNEFINQANKNTKITNKLADDVWKANFNVSSKPFNLRGAKNEVIILRFDFTNISIDDTTKGKQYEHTLFNCTFKVNLNGLKHREFQDEYDYEGFKQRYYYDFRTINCQAYWLDEEKIEFSTRHHDVFHQPNVRPKDSLENIDVSFSKLACEKTCVDELKQLLNQLNERAAEYDSRINISITNEFQPRMDNREVTWKERMANVNHFKEVIKLFEKGVDILETDKDARISFNMMNDAFDDYYSSRGIPGASWRLFQIVFIVAGLRSIVREEDLDIVDVLHVGTGGGKSEAYFGLVIMTLFFDRIKGKKNGVTAIVKFPLRMLSIQQLERLACVIIFAEEIRKKYLMLFGGDEFSLGYYVGNQTMDFPGTYSELRCNLYKDKEFKDIIEPAPISKIISKCPLCDIKDPGIIRQIDDIQGKRVLQVCDKVNSHRFYIYLSDRELFRYRPSIIVSTVDKWAGLTQQRRARALLGAKGSMCPNGHGFIPCGDKCEDKSEEGICEEIGLDEETADGPILSIQDEMHLLREGFGTISSHFEGIIEEVVKANSSGRSLKHVVMSATLNGTDRQVFELYNKKAAILPGPSPEGFGSERDFFYTLLPGENRIIYGLKPNLRDNHYASLRTLRHIIEYLSNAQSSYADDSSTFMNDFGFSNEKDVLREFMNHLIPLTYHPKVQDAEDMNRFTNTVINDYLGSKGYLEGTVLTGGRGLDELKDTINNVRDTVEKYNITEQIKPNAIYSSLYATSVVSHGVDLEELNLMVFQGIPYSTSEYIQALSRVGRKYRGIVILWFYPNRVRDDSFYRNFKRYHDTLDHAVKPVPINRTARLGTMQTINSIFCAGILQYLSELQGSPIYHKKHIVDLKISQEKLLVKFIRNVYGRPVEINIEEEVEARLNQIKYDSNSNDNTFFPNILVNSGNHYFRNQSGMRGIQKQLILDAYDPDQIKKIWVGK
ncbi:MAG: hypothetical protein FP824_10970 [Euryarchaeota archaeon]|nr:hypothetical protein [Euryarchaeota archaeon]